uniref:Uncharacterized protein n=1 Tax=viral metagenome TaxID=1070528 RepID=A0A6M3IZ19_9ZZZZ
MTLQNEAICVRLFPSQWGAKKVDKSVSKDTRDRYNAASDAGSFSKKLAPAEFLSGVNTAFSAIAEFHKDMTVAWDDDGFRLLPNADYFDYMAGLDERKSAISRAVDLIIAGWDDFVNAERQRLGNMFNIDDYPKRHEVSEKYGVKIKRKIITDAGDIRIANHDKIEDAVREEVIAEQAENHKRAMTDLWSRLYGPVKKLADKIQDVDMTGARKTLVEDIWEVTQILPKLNVFGDPELKAMAEEVADRLCTHSVKKLKIDENAYAETKAAVDEIMKKMEGYVL